MDKDLQITDLNNKLSQDEIKELNLLKASFEMLEDSKIKILEEGKKEVSKMISTAQDETLSKIGKISQEMAAYLVENAKDREKNVKVKKPSLNNEKNTNKPTSIDDLLNEINKDKNMTEDEFMKEHQIQTRKRTKKTNSVKEEKEIKEEVFISKKNNSQIDEAYDIIPLPSNGECYKNKLANIKVSYLTASDENVITSPHLYRDGLVIDVLLKRKVLEDTIDTDNLCSGDADAITLWLRATSYGTDFPISVEDPDTGKRIETIFDLTKIKYKPFKLKGDENGFFEYILPISKDVVKFKFLTRKEERDIEKESIDSNDYAYNFNVSKLLNELKNLSYSSVLQRKIKDNDKIIEVIDALNDMMTVEKIDNLDIPLVGTMITTRLEKSIVSINGNDDKEFIKHYINNMRAKDSLMLRRYMLENEPGLDFEIEIERPKSLGGGSFKTFLEWDDSIFLNIT